MFYLPKIKNKKHQKITLLTQLSDAHYCYKYWLKLNITAKFFSH
jgi:hypothetical protein